MLNNQKLNDNENKTTIYHQTILKSNIIGIIFNVDNSKTIYEYI